MKLFPNFTHHHLITHTNVSYYFGFHSIHCNQVILLPVVCWQFDTKQQLQRPNERRSAKCFEDFEENKLREAEGQTMILLTKSSILRDTKASTAEKNKTKT